MAIRKPYRRTCRPVIGGGYNWGAAAGADYMKHPKFAKDAAQYVRAFLLLQKDLQELFEYIEPSEKNPDCHSYRLHALLMRVCIEVEANFKAILIENRYPNPGNLNIGDYYKVNASHRLSSYEIRLPFWFGTGNVRKPFGPWAKGKTSLPWYQAYNGAKHDRHTHFSDASFAHVIDAMSGLVAIISSQFIQEDFSPVFTHVVPLPGDYFQLAIGLYFEVHFPDDWPDAEKYQFNWHQLTNESEDPFEQITF